jgi:phosphonate transport system substrate-binding protein
MENAKKIIFTILLIIAMLPPANVIAQEEFIIGLIPEENIFKQVKRHRPLAEYLTKRLGIKVKFTILSRYPDIIDRFVTRRMDGAFFGIFTSILAQEKLGVEPMARPVNLDGSSMARAYVFARRDSGINTATDMKGKKAVFVDKATATGYLYILALLRDFGIRDMKGHFSSYSFSGSHDSVVYSVLTGRADVGVVKGRILDEMASKDPVVKDEMIILAKSEELPDVTLCVRQNLSTELRTMLKNILLTMHKNPEGKEVLKKMGALKFVTADKEDFNVVRSLAINAGIKSLRDFDYK